VEPTDLPVHFSPSLAPWTPFIASPEQHRDIAARWRRSSHPDRRCGRSSMSCWQGRSRSGRTSAWGGLAKRNPPRVRWMRRVTAKTPILTASRSVRETASVEPGRAAGTPWKDSPSPLAGEGSSDSATKRMGEGPPHPIEFFAIVSLPSPARGEGNAFGAGARCTPQTQKLVTQ